MTISNTMRSLRNGLLAALLLALAVAIPALAAEQAKHGSESQTGNHTDTMPSTPAQTEELREAPDDKTSTPTQQQGGEMGDMPATQSQQEHLRESDKMSGDKKSSGKSSTQ